MTTYVTGTGGGGGGGGSGVVAGSSGFFLGTVSAGNGGAGGQATVSGGGGGAGGYGILASSASTLTVYGTVSAGTGGSGGSATAAAGSGGDGGIGVYFGTGGSSLTLNAGSVSGGAGGAGGGATGSSGARGSDGAGVEGTSLTVQIEAGTIAGGGGANALLFDGGTNYLQMDGGTLGGGIGVTGTLDLRQSTAAAVTFSTVISGTGAVVADAGSRRSFTLAASNTYSGGTNVSSGTLRANAAAATGTGTVTILPNGTLGGTGSVGAVTVDGDGTITAGPDANTVGTLTTGSETWNNGGLYAPKVVGSSTDQLVMSGLTVNASAGEQFRIYLTGTTAATLPDGRYTLATDKGVTSGDPFKLSALLLEVNGASAPSTYTLTEQDDTGDVALVLVATPEPTALLLLGTSVLPLTVRRRRRR